jgi:membrane protein DedA with SNARE-associated domain
VDLAKHLLGGFRGRRAQWRRPAGISKMRWRLFVVANASGGIIWAGVYTLAAYLAGNMLRQVSGIIDWVLIGVAVVAIVAVFLLVRRRISGLAARAEAAYPGPLQ